MIERKSLQQVAWLKIWKLNILDTLYYKKLPSSIKQTNTNKFARAALFVKESQGRRLSLNWTQIFI